MKPRKIGKLMIRAAMNNIVLDSAFERTGTSDCTLIMDKLDKFGYNALYRLSDGSPMVCAIENISDVFIGYPDEIRLPPDPFRRKA